jgi:hypothetical protein
VPGIRPGTLSERPEPERRPDQPAKTSQDVPARGRGKLPRPCRKSCMLAHDAPWFSARLRYSTSPADHDAVKVKILEANRAIDGISTDPTEAIVIVTSSDLAAQEATNLTNRLAIGNQGVQIEQRLDVHQSHGLEIATAVASVFTDRI